MTSYTAESVEQGILIKQPLAIDSQKSYEAKLAGKDTLVVHETGNDVSAGMLGISSFENLLLSLADNKWTGKITTVVGDAAKHVYISNGRLVFAASNQIDDRMGEVIYRKGMISLDDMMDAAVLVTKESKFGQVCLEKDTFTNEDLWLALRAQIMTVVKSVFMYSHVSFSLEPMVKAPTEVALWESTRSIFSQCAAYGAMYRYFERKLEPGTEIRVSQSLKQHIIIEQGSFIGDLCQLCVEKAKLQDILHASKLLPQNTKAELLDLYIRGRVSLVGQKKVMQSLSAPFLSHLKSLVEGYGMVTSTIFKVYQSLGKELPVRICRQVCEKIDSKICPSLYISETLNLTKESIDLLFAQCVVSRERTSLMEENIRGLIQFVVLAAGDSLPYEKAREIKVFYKTMIQ